MDGILIVILAVVIVAVVAAVIVATRTPRGSGGAPGEVVADEPLTGGTGADWEDSRVDAGPAEDRPGGPSAETMDPEQTEAGAEEHPEGR